MSTSRSAALREFISTYEKCCNVSLLPRVSASAEPYQEVAKKHGKNFDFIKQHHVSHVDDDILTKGVTSNYVTRPGEGFQQEVKQLYRHTNFREAELQVCLPAVCLQLFMALRCLGGTTMPKLWHTSE